MSCNRQNFRPAGNQFGMNQNQCGCAANGVAPVNVCGAGCQTQGTVISGGTTAGCGAPCPTVQLEELPLGMAYVPWQTFGTMYPMQQGMRRGTMFPCLDFDFMGRRCN